MFVGLASHKDMFDKHVLLVTSDKTNVLAKQYFSWWPTVQESLTSKVRSVCQATLAILSRLAGALACDCDCKDYMEPGGHLLERVTRGSYRF